MSAASGNFNGLFLSYTLRKGSTIKVSFLTGTIYPRLALSPHSKEILPKIFYFGLIGVSKLVYESVKEEL